MDLEKQLEFEREMSLYAKTSGTIEEFESTGVISDRYKEYEIKLYTKLFGDNSKAKSIEFYNSSDDGGIPLIMVQTLAVIVWPYNDNIESYTINGLYAFNFSLYDRSFYRDRTITIDGYVYFQVHAVLPYYASNNAGSAYKWW
jgi:hypothetical protein